MKKKFECLKNFVSDAIRQSTLFRALGEEGIKTSVFYALLCIPYYVFCAVCRRYGSKIRDVKNSSLIAGKITFGKALILFAAVSPFISNLTKFAGAALAAVYIIEAVSEQGFAEKPAALDALICIFGAVFAVGAGGFGANGVLAFLIYYVITNGMKSKDIWKKTVFVFIICAAASAAVGRIGSGKIYTEFYVLIIPFAFAAAKELEKPYKSMVYGFCIILALIFITGLSKGIITPAGIALGVFLCIRDMRFVLPIAAAAAALFGLFGSVLAAAREYSFSFVSGGASLIMSAFLYLNLMNYSRKKTFMRNVTAALGSCNVLYLSGGGKSGTEFIFFVILALTSSLIRFGEKK